MKKLLFLIFPVILVLIAIACNNSGNQSDDKKTIDTSIIAPTDTAAVEINETIAPDNTEEPAAPVKKAPERAFEYFEPSENTP